MQFDRVSLTIELAYIHMRIHCGLSVSNIEDFWNPITMLVLLGETLVFLVLFTG